MRVRFVKVNHSLHHDKYVRPLRMQNQCGLRNVLLEIALLQFELLNKVQVKTQNFTGLRYLLVLGGLQLLRWQF